MPQMPDDGTLVVGVLDTQDQRPPEVCIDLGEPCDVISFPPEYAILLAQLLVKNARLAGYTGPFVELPVEENHTLN